MGDMSAGATTRRSPAHRRKKFAAFTGRFWHLWATFTLSSTGDGFAYGAVPLLAVAVDHWAVAVSAVAAADRLPWLLAALPAGAVSDRFERGRLMAMVNTARGLLLAGMAVVIATGHMTFPLLVIFVLGNGTARTVYYSASQAAVPELVDADGLGKANGILTGTEAGGEHLAGPVVGAAAFVMSRMLPFVADAVAVGGSGLALFGLRTNPPDRTARRGSMWDGTRLLFRDRRLRLLVTLIATLSGLQGLVSGILVLVATHDWGVHPRYYGVFLAAGAVGNVPGALMADRIVAKIGTSATLVAAAVISGAAYLVMAMSSNWLLAGGAFILVGVAVAAGSVVAIALRQRLSPNEVMGRVGSAWRGIVWGAAPVGALLAGGLAVLGGYRLPIYLAGAAQCLVALMLARPLFRRLSHPALAKFSASSSALIGSDDALSPPPEPAGRS